MSSYLRAPTFRISIRILAFLAACWFAGEVCAEPSPELREDEPDRPDGIHVLDGSYVIDAGQLLVNVTNHGLIGSQYSAFLSYSNAPSAQWPGGTGDEYLYAAGLWIGGKLDGQISVTTGQPQRELRPDDSILATIYESRERKVLRPTPATDAAGARLPDVYPDDDRDGKVDEDLLNGYDDDGDGKVDEDYGQIGDQMLTCTMYDNTRLAREIYTDHRPLGVRVVQRVSGWYEQQFEDIVAIEYEITNQNFNEIEDLYLGFYVDCDIQNRSEAATQPDDLTGYFNGAIRDQYGVFHRIQFGWMQDAHPSDPLPGVFGVMMLDHTTNFAQLTAPHVSGVRTYQRFTTGATTYQGGEPLNDDDRYDIMTKTRPDPDSKPERPDDYRFMISSGPFPVVLPGATIHYRLAMVVGDGMDDLMRTAVRASLLQRGRWFNLDNDYSTGVGGMEHKVCLGDLPKNPDGSEPLYDYRFWFMDEFCAGDWPVFMVDRISRDIMWPDEDGRTCLYVNADNCEECFRREGRECDLVNMLFWDPQMSTVGVTGPIATGTGGREHRAAWVGGGEVPPPRPSMRADPGNRQVEIFWDDRAEHEPDYYRGVVDFESYRIWRVMNWQRPEGLDADQAPPAHLWSLVDEFDIKNFIEPGLAFNVDEHPLGQNTGLEVISYSPVCLSDPKYRGLDEAMRELVANDTQNEIRAIPPVRDPNGVPTPGFEILLPWAYYPAVLDTFFAVTERVDAPGIVPKPATRYYHYIDDDIPNGFTAYHAVTARDHSLVWHEGQYKPNGYGVEIPPESNYDSSIPHFEAQTPAERDQEGANIYVYPNPVTREALADFDQQYPSLLDATGSHIAFANLPRAQNTITIYTAAGDLVDTIEHDGTDGSGSAIWNLMSRNGQEIVSGIYLFAVQSHDSNFEDFVGRFVVIW